MLIWTPRRASEDSTNWVEAARRLPLAFAQVREDAWIDRELVEFGACGDILMIASGGCTAALLATMPQVEQLTLVDMNAAQLALARLKLLLLREAGRDERLAVLGHSPLDARVRHARLSAAFDTLELSADIFGPAELAAELGPDRLGRYEWVFERLRQDLADVSHELDRALRCRDVVEQAALVRVGTPLGDRLDQALDRVLDLDTLVALFGPLATANRVQPFARHFAERIRVAFGTLPAADNPFLWQMLTSRFPDGVAFPWFDASPPRRWPELEFQHQTIQQVLEDSTADRFDLIHLSNILDWLEPADAAQTLALASRALRRGGFVVIRQLNSRLDIRRLPSSFEWLASESQRWHAADRSFFYRDLHVGRRL